MNDLIERLRFGPDDESRIYLRLEAANRIVFLEKELADASALLSRVMGNIHWPADPPSYSDHVYDLVKAIHDFLTRKKP